MNLACSYLRPIEGKLHDVICEVAASNKIRLNVELGKQMMNELRFYTIDVTELGDSSGDEGDTETDLFKMLSQGIDEEGESDDEAAAIQSKIMATQEYEGREAERRHLLENEMNINEF